MLNGVSAHVDVLLALAELAGAAMPETTNARLEGMNARWGCSSMDRTTYCQNHVTYR